MKKFIKQLFCNHSYDADCYECDAAGRSWDIQICSKCGKQKRHKNYRYKLRIIRVDKYI